MPLKKCELLAPAGGMRELAAAVENGADAVYIGGRLFNARMNASNFGDEEMKQAVAYAHARNVKIYVTMNILLKDKELPEAVSYAADLYNIGVDALIIQDFGFGALLRKFLPGMPLHLSTQATVCNLSAAKTAGRLGYSRIVPARELSLPEIRELCGQSGVEIEVFIHGALCICYSGQCHMSRVIGGRSGNRGLCAQPCRLPYEIITGQKNQSGQINSQRNSHRNAGHENGLCYPLSPRDLCTVDFLPQLIEAGTASFKIEGRMKSAEYVGTVTSVYRKYIDLYYSLKRENSAGGNTSFNKYIVDDSDRKALLQIFNRGNFTSGYLKKNPGAALMSGTLPKHQGVFVGKVAGISKGKNLIDIALNPGSDIELSDGIEIHCEGLPGNVVTYRKELGNSLLRIGDIRGNVRPGADVYKISAGRQLAEIRRTFTPDKDGNLKPHALCPVHFRLTAELGKAPELEISECRFEGAAAGFEDRSEGAGQGAAAGFEGRSEGAGQGAISIKIRADNYICEKAVTKELTEQAAGAALRKCGGTPYRCESVSCSIEKGISVPASVLNELRRKALTLLEEKKSECTREKADSQRIGESVQLEIAKLAKEASLSAECSSNNASAAGAGAFGPGRSTAAGFCGEGGSAEGGFASRSTAAGFCGEDKSAEIPALELFFYNFQNKNISLCRHIKSLIDGASVSGPGHDAAASKSQLQVRILIPLTEFAGHEALVQNEAEKLFGKCAVMPYITNVSRGPEDNFIAKNFNAIVKSCAETGIVAGSLSWIKEFLDAGIRVYGDYGLNVFNSASRYFFENLGIQILSGSHEAIEHDANIPLMISEHNFGFEFMRDRKNQLYHMEQLPQGGKFIIRKAFTDIQLKELANDSLGKVLSGKNHVARIYM
ncbi:MAG: U32 family peptidase [Clostridia bacterium]|nr:U32 family peptidase [Clostridia bacterium]